MKQLINEWIEDFGPLPEGATHIFLFPTDKSDLSRAVHRDNHDGTAHFWSHNRQQWILSAIPLRDEHFQEINQIEQWISEFGPLPKGATHFYMVYTTQGAFSRAVHRLNIDDTADFWSPVCQQWVPAIWGDSKWYEEINK